MLLAEGEGLVVLRFQPSLLSESLDCYLEELYVVPSRRRCGIGTALMKAALTHARDRGAGYAYLGTGEDDVGARALYEGLGFSHRGGHATGPVNYFYEREADVIAVRRTDPHRHAYRRPREMSYEAEA